MQKVVENGDGEWVECSPTRECKLKSYQSHSDFRYNLQHNHTSSG